MVKKVFKIALTFLIFFSKKELNERIENMKQNINLINNEGINAVKQLIIRYESYI